MLHLLLLVGYLVKACGICGTCYCIVLYSSIYILPLNSCGPTDVLLVRLPPYSSFKKWYCRRKIVW